MAFTGTPAAERCELAVLNRFGGLLKSVGQYNRRKISGSSTWSQHSWGNGLDFMVKGSTTAEWKKNGDPIFAFLNANRKALGIRVLLWQVKDHYNHIHADFWGKGVYTPPLSSTGVGSFQKSSGSVVKKKIQEAPHEGGFPFEDEVNVREVYARLQASLIRAGHDLGNYTPYLPAGDPDSLPGADGVWGKLARAAQDKANASAGAAPSNVYTKSQADGRFAPISHPHSATAKVTVS